MTNKYDNLGVFIITLHHMCHINLFFFRTFYSNILTGVLMIHTLGLKGVIDGFSCLFIKFFNKQNYDRFFPNFNEK